MYKENWILQGISTKRIRTWDIHLEDIPNIIVGAIDYLMWFAFTLAIVMIILWAIKYLISRDKRVLWELYMWVIIWLSVTSLGWFIVKFLIDNLW